MERGEKKWEDRRKEQLTDTLNGSEKEKHVYPELRMTKVKRNRL